MSPSSTNDARGADRYETTLFASVEGETPFTEYRGNVSSGGFCLHAGHQFPAGTRLEIIFRLPGAGYWMQASGLVQGCTSTVCAVAVRGRFTGVQAGEVDHLTRWLDAAARQVA